MGKELVFLWGQNPCRTLSLVGGVYELPSIPISLCLEIAKHNLSSLVDILVSVVLLDHGCPEY